jgi:hypothetical protein
MIPLVCPSKRRISPIFSAAAGGSGSRHLDVGVVGGDDQKPVVGLDAVDGHAKQPAAEQEQGEGGSHQQVPAAPAARGMSGGRGLAEPAHGSRVDERRQRLGDGGRGLVAASGIFRHHAFEDEHEILRDAAVPSSPGLGAFSTGAGQAAA